MSVTVTGTWGNNSTNTYQNCEDTYIYEYDQDANFSTASGIELYNNNAGTKAYAILRFNPSNQIPYASDIIDARIRLYLESSTESSAFSFYVYRLLQPWVLSEVTWNRFNYSVTWNFDGAKAVSSSGEDDGVYDIRSPYISTLYSDVIPRWVEVDVTSLAQQWVNKEAKEYGVKLYAAFSSVDTTILASSRGVDGFRPYLQITYNLKYHFTGTVLDQGVPASGITLIAHKRDTFEPMGYTTTSGDGSYDLITTYSGSQYLVCLDKSGGIQYNDKILGLMIPEEF